MVVIIFGLIFKQFVLFILNLIYILQSLEFPLSTIRDFSHGRCEVFLAGKNNLINFAVRAFGWATTGRGALRRDFGGCRGKPSSCRGTGRRPEILYIFRLRLLRKFFEYGNF
jgi:hypothetical protein